MSEFKPIGVGTPSNREEVIKEYCGWNGRTAVDIVGATAIGTIVPGVGNLVGFVYSLVQHSQNCADAMNNGSAHFPGAMDLFDYVDDVPQLISDLSKAIQGK
jgi:hypothetical protein